MVMISSWIEGENDGFEDQLMKNLKFKILGVVDRWGKPIISLDHIWHKKLS